MKPTNPKPCASRRKAVASAQSLHTIMAGLRRPFTNPTAAPDAALHRFGPARPTKPGTQI
jgi:hypothetical protein